MTTYSYSVDAFLSRPFVVYLLILPSREKSCLSHIICKIKWNQ